MLHFENSFPADRDTLVGMKLLAIFLLSTVLALAADVTGTWTAQVNLTAGSGTPKLEFKQTGETLTGTCRIITARSAMPRSKAQ